MSQETDKWLEIAVKPTSPNAQVSRLDDHLTQSSPALVEQELKDGQFSYKPDKQGEYQVRCFVPAMLGFVDMIIKHNAFEIVRIKEMPEGKEIKLPAQGKISSS
jgi:hypothetical protein